MSSSGVRVRSGILYTMYTYTLRNHTWYAWVSYTLKMFLTDIVILLLYPPDPLSHVPGRLCPAAGAWSIGRTKFIFFQGAEPSALPRRWVSLTWIHLLRVRTRSWPPGQGGWFWWGSRLSVLSLYLTSPRRTLQLSLPFTFRSPVNGIISKVHP